MKNFWLAGVIAFALVWVFGGIHVSTTQSEPGNVAGVASLAASSGIGSIHKNKDASFTQIDIKNNRVASFLTIRNNRVASLEDLTIRNNKVVSFEKGIISKDKHSIIMEAAYFGDMLGYKKAAQIHDKLSLAGDLVWSNKNKFSLIVQI